MSVVDYSVHGHIAVITMRRPERLNAMSDALMTDLAGCWNRFANDDDAWIAILTGEGRAFCAGMDFKERTANGSARLVAPPAWPANPWWSYELEKPTIAAVNGLALGGGTFMVTRCDLRVAAESAYFQVTEIQRGGISGSPSFELLLTENVPYAVLAELAAGRVLDARRAHQVGFVNSVVPDETTLSAAMEVAEELCSYPPLAVHHHLALMRDHRRAQMKLPRDLNQRTDAARELLNASQDMGEAFASLVDKRPPSYQRR